MRIPGFLLVVVTLLLALGACGGDEEEAVAFEVGPGGYLCEVEVVDGATGEPVPQAQVVCTGAVDWSGDHPIHLSGVEFAHQVALPGSHADERGRLDVRLVATDSWVCAFAAGRIGAAQPDPSDPRRCRVELVDDFAVEGRVVDAGGYPIANVCAWLVAAGPDGRPREFAGDEAHPVGFLTLRADGRFRVPHVPRVVASGALGEVHEDEEGRPLLCWRVAGMGGSWTVPADLDEPTIVELPETALLQLRARSAQGDLVSTEPWTTWSASPDHPRATSGTFRPSGSQEAELWESVVPVGGTVEVQLRELFPGDLECAFEVSAPEQAGQRRIVERSLPADLVTLGAEVVDDRGLPLAEGMVTLDFANADSRSWMLDPQYGELPMRLFLRPGDEPPRLVSVWVTAQGHRSVDLDRERTLSPGHHDLGTFRLVREPDQSAEEPGERRASVQVLLPSPNVLRREGLLVEARPPVGELGAWDADLRAESPCLFEADLECPAGPFDLVVTMASRVVQYVGRFELPAGGRLDLRGVDAIDLRQAWRTLWLIAVDESGRRVPWQGMWFDADDEWLGGTLPEVGIHGRRIHVPRRVQRLALWAYGQPLVVVDAAATRATVVVQSPVQAEIRAEWGSLPAGIVPVLGYRVLRDHWDLPLDHPARWLRSRTAWQIERSVVGPVLRGEFHPGTELEVTVSLEREGGGGGARVDVVTHEVVVEREDGSDAWRLVVEVGRAAVVRALEELGR